MAFEMDDETKGIDSAMRMALNIVPIEHKDIGISDEKAKEIINAVISNAQAKMISLKFLKAAVQMERSKSVRNRIMKRMQDFLDDAMSVEKKGEAK